MSGLNKYKLKKIFNVKNIILISLIIGAVIIYTNTRPKANSLGQTASVNPGNISGFVKSPQGFKIPDCEKVVKETFDKTTKGMKEATNTLK